MYRWHKNPAFFNWKDDLLRTAIGYAVGLVWVGLCLFGISLL